MRTLITVVAIALCPLLNPALAHEQDGDGKPGPAEKLGTVQFVTSCNAAVEQQFNRGMAMFHSFWFDPAMQVFKQVSEADPGCAMAHWGMALTRIGNPFAWPPPEKSFSAGQSAIAKAREVGTQDARERDYIAALSLFYDDPAKADHRTRSVAFQKAMGELVTHYPQDVEAQILYALLLDATASANDKTFAQQLQAGAMLEKILETHPDHPGVVHYIIHSYDYPQLADKALGAAKRYAAIAPSAPHALHMPAHIFTRLGYWDESIETNRLSAQAARAELTDQQLSQGSYNALHAMDYMVYAYLQQGRDAQARALVDEMAAITQLDVQNFPAAYALAASPARYALERGDWAKAATLKLTPKELQWEKFPQAEAVSVFARALGAAREGNVEQARAGIDRLHELETQLLGAKQPFWAEQVGIQADIATAWMLLAKGDQNEALDQMRKAADREDGTDKHPVTPGPLAPARELLGDMLLQLKLPAQALFEYQRSQEKEPNRLRGYYGAAHAAELSNNAAVARANYEKLSKLTLQGDSSREEVARARAFATQN